MVTLTMVAPALSWGMGSKPKAPVADGRLMVRFEDGVSQERIREIWAAEGIEKVTFLANVGIYVVTLPVGVEPAEFKRRIEAYPRVRFVEVDARTEPLEGGK